MTKWILMIFLVFSLAVPASALEIEAPTVPDSGKTLMPEQKENFGEGLLELMQKAVSALHPDLKEAAKVSGSLLSVVLLLAVLELGSEQAGKMAKVAGAAAIAAVLLQSTNSMIGLASETVTQLSDYGKLLFPVMASALAAQGGATGSAGLYIGTTFFSTLLNSLLSNVFVEAVYLYLALSTAAAAIGEDLLKKMRDTIKNTVVWCLKTILTVFTTYMSITGVVSGTTDAAALKAMKVTISSMVPVVGGILSDASETVLVGAGLLKNSAGIYGIFAVLSVFLGPFLRIGAHYLLLKATAAVSGMFGGKGVVSLIEDFSSALGLLLAVTGSTCLLLLVSTVCFLKGVG